MIQNFLLNGLILITQLLPQVDLTDLNFLIDAQYVVQQIAIRWNMFTDIIPFMDDIMTTALVIATFEIALLVAKFFLGSRTPWNDKSVHF